MRAAMMQGLDKPLKVETVPDPTPGEGELVVKVGRCGICGSDLHMTHDPAFGKGAGDVLGHEFAGEVAAVGRDAQPFRVGDLVSVVPLKSCGACPACLAGEPAWCARMQLQGGGYAEYALADARQCVRLPASVSLADGAIVEPLAVALHAVNLSGLEAGDRVLVLGAGPIGLAVAFWARRRGAARVVVQDIAPHQRDRAMRMGATDFIIDLDAPLAASDRSLGGKADLVFECVGAPGLIAQAIDQVRPRGTVVLLGLCTAPAGFVPFVALSKEVRIQTSAFFKRQEYEAALDMLADGAAAPRDLVTATVGLDAAPAAFEALRDRTTQCKVLIAPWN